MKKSRELKVKKPKLIKVKKVRRKKTLEIKKANQKMGTKLVFKIAAILLIVFLNWNGLSIIGQTFAYMNDTESSTDNNFTAGTLDFELEVPVDFPASAIEIGGFATKTINLINLGNIHKYKVRADNFSGELCNYLNLEANLDGGLPEYTGSLISFDFGPATFTDPDTWNFTLNLPSGTPEEVIGETCEFKFVFWGSQTRNDLPFGMGFNDAEEEDNNVKAKICYDAQTLSKGYWKNPNHYDVYKSYLPQYLGCNTTSSECVAGYEAVSNKAKVIQILDTDYNLSMRNKLRGQLLAMKFNIAHFKIGEYIPPSSTDNLNQIVSQADALLKQVPAPSDGILETMKNLLDGLNQDLQFRTCSGSFVKVIIPNGGEVWWVGQTYDLTWTTQNLVCSNNSLVSIWYSKDSGATWGNIATSTENDGVYSWRIPLYLEGGTYYVPSHNARIKVVTRCSETLLVNGWDMSDSDFCPPIDFGLLTPEELEQAKALGLLPEGFIVGSGNQEINPEETSTTSEEISTTTEEVSTTTEEIIIEEILGGGSGGTAVSTDEIIIAPEETSTEELPVEELPAEEPPVEELPIEETLTEEPSVIENIPVEEEISIDQTPAIEQEVIMTPQDSSSVQNGSGDSGGDPPAGGGSGDSAPIVSEPPAAVVETASIAPVEASVVAE